MVILILGPTHTGKTLLAQQLMEHLKFSVLSQDHLKMGLIRSHQTTLTVFDDEQMTNYLWPITKEIIKTVIENHQNLIIEGCYIPFDWKNSFEEHYLAEIMDMCLVMSEDYLINHDKEILKYGNVIEHRIENIIDLDCLIEDHKYHHKMCQKYQVPMIWINEKYNVFEQALMMIQYKKSDTIKL